MKKRIILYIAITVVLITAIITLAVLVVDSHQNSLKISDVASVTVTQPKDVSGDYSKDLKAAFAKAMADSNLPKESVVMFDSYVGKANRPVNINFADNKDNLKEYYMASTVKLAYVSAFLNILNIKDPNYKIPFKFINDFYFKDQIAADIYEYTTAGGDIDQLETDYLVPFFKDRNLTKSQIYAELINRPELRDYKFTMKDLIGSILGPSSNTGIVVLRNYLGLQKNESEEQATNEIENFINNYLTKNGLPASLRINVSTKSAKDKKSNSIDFYEAEYLFESFYENKFNIDPNLFALMKQAMQNVSDNPARHNRRHEMKSIAKGLFSNESAYIIEKSGYIGFDLGAAPALDADLGFDKLPKVSGKRVVIFEASSFSRIFFTNGRFVQFDYAIAVPIYISLSPNYEELNSDYLKVKDNILDNLQTNVRAVMERYKGNIAVN